MSKSISINIKGKDIIILNHDNSKYICLTHIVEAYSGGNGNGTIDRWMSNKNTIEFLGGWESIENPNFNYPEFGVIKSESGVNRFNLSAKRWIESTNAIGIEAKPGRYGGTYAHEEIALEFCTWLDPLFKLLVVKEFKRLKENESNSSSQIWDYRRFLTKANYRVQTDAIKDVLIPAKNLPKDKEGFVYAEEADLLYVAMYGFTSRQWRKNNPELSAKSSNLRNYADTHQLIVLNSLEAINAELIRNNVDIKDRLVLLRKAAIAQLASIKKSVSIEDSLIESPNKTAQRNIWNSKSTPTLSPGKIKSGDPEFDAKLNKAIKKGKPK